MLQQDRDSAWSLLERARELVESARPGRDAGASDAGARAHLAFVMGSMAEARTRAGWGPQARPLSVPVTRLCREAITLSREMGDAWGEAMAHLCLVRAERYGARYREARAACLEALEVFRRLGDPRGELAALLELATATVVLSGPMEAERWWGPLMNRGMILLGRGDAREAERCLQESLDDLPPGMAVPYLTLGLVYLGRALLAQGKLAKGRRTSLRVLREAGRRKHFGGRFLALRSLAWALALEGRLADAAELVGLLEALGGPARGLERDSVMRHVEALLAALPDDMLVAAPERGRSRDLEATVAELLEEFDDGQGESRRFIAVD